MTLSCASWEDCTRHQVVHSRTLDARLQAQTEAAQRDEHQEQTLQRTSRR